MNGLEELRSLVARLPEALEEALAAARKMRREVVLDSKWIEARARELDQLGLTVSVHGRRANAAFYVAHASVLAAVSALRELERELVDVLSGGGR